MRISVFGLGYVGAVSSACIAAAGHGRCAPPRAPSKLIDLVRIKADFRDNAQYAGICW